MLPDRRHTNYSDMGFDSVVCHSTLLLRIAVFYSSSLMTRDVVHADAENVWQNNRRLDTDIHYGGYLGIIGVCRVICVYRRLILYN